MSQSKGERLKFTLRTPIDNLQAFARRDDCLDLMVPSDLRVILARLCAGC